MRRLHLPCLLSVGRWIIFSSFFWPGVPRTCLRVNACLVMIGRFPLEKNVSKDGGSPLHCALGGHFQKPSDIWKVPECLSLGSSKSRSEVKVAQSCPTLCDPMDYRVYGILQAGILEWVALPFSRRSSQPRDRTQVFRITGRFFTS